MITVVLFDNENRPVGRATLPASVSEIPTVVLWNDRAYLYDDEHISGHRYHQVRTTVEIPSAELRKAPGLG